MQAILQVVWNNYLGSGSVLEALHLRKPLIVAPNSSLMDNHQAEVAKALSKEGYLLESTPEYAPSNGMTDFIRDLSGTLLKLKGDILLRQFPASGNQRFAQILDEELGLI